MEKAEVSLTLECWEAYGEIFEAFSQQLRSDLLTWILFYPQAN
jgi:hypothetical protein